MCICITKKSEVKIMNRYQRIILITAAIVLIVALWTTPKYARWNGYQTKINKLPALIKETFRRARDLNLDGKTTRYARVSEESQLRFVKNGFIVARRDLKTAAVRAAGVIGASLFLYFAAGNVRRKKEVIT